MLDGGRRFDLSHSDLRDTVAVDPLDRQLDPIVVHALALGGHVSEQAVDESPERINLPDRQGEFERGELVSCLDPGGTEIARGLINYGSGETRKILRAPSHEIEARLGYIDEPELIHRDNLVLL